MNTPQTWPQRKWKMSEKWAFWSVVLAVCSTIKAKDIVYTFFLAMGLYGALIGAWIGLYCAARWLDSKIRRKA